MEKAREFQKNIYICFIDYAKAFVWITTNCGKLLKRWDFANKGLSSQGYGFSSSHVWMWELDCEESWVPRNRCFWSVVLEKTLESPLDCKIKPVNSKGNQSWICIRRTPEYTSEGQMLKLKLQYFGHLMWRADSLEDPDAGKDWGQEEKGTTEDEMVGWH